MKGIPEGKSSEQFLGLQIHQSYWLMILRTEEMNHRFEKIGERGAQAVEGEKRNSKNWNQRINEVEG